MSSNAYFGLIETVILRMIEQKLITSRVRGKIGPSLTLKDLELDSIGKMSLLVEIEKELELEIPFHALGGIETLAHLSETLKRVVEERSAA